MIGSIEKMAEFGHVWYLLYIWNKNAKTTRAHHTVIENSIFNGYETHEYLYVKSRYVDFAS